MSLKKPPAHLWPFLTVLVAALMVLGLFVAGGARAGDPNPNCQLTVPADPLSAAGLATPYQLSAQDPADGPCNEANTVQSAFVEAAVWDPAAHTLSVYHPLVIDKGTTPFAAPVPVALPKHAVVGIWFGSNGDTLKLVGRGAKHAVNGLGHGDLFGQFSYINAPDLFHAVNAAVKAHKFTIPALGVSPMDKLPCPTVRDFSVVDQDQSDNVATAYALGADGRLAQWTAKNQTGATKMTNGSDEGTLANRIDKALGCAPFTLPSLDDPGVMVTSLVGNELSAAAGQKAPVALVPLNDPMTLVGDNTSVRKTDLYRVGVDQPAINPHKETLRGYCTNLTTVAPPRAVLDAPFFTGPGPNTGQSLGEFLADRYQATLQILGCAKALQVHDGGHHR